MEEILTYPYTNPRVKIKRAEIRYTDFFNFLGSLLVGLGEPNIYHDSGGFYLEVVGLVVPSFAASRQKLD